MFIAPEGAAFSYEHGILNNRTITKFSVLIGSTCHVVGVSNYRYPIATFCTWMPVIGHLRHSRVNYVRFDGFLLNVSPLFVQLMENTTEVLRVFLISKFAIDTIN